MKNLRFFLLISLCVDLSIFANNKSTIEVKSMNDFYKAINSDKPTIIKFFAPWCGACTAMAPTFENAAQDYKDVAQFVNVDVTNDALKDAVDMFGIQATPTLIYKEIGLKDKAEFNKRLESFLKKPAPAKKPASKTTQKPAPKNNNNNNSKAKPKAAQVKKTTTAKKS